jgi:DNA-binding transcriptional ArsR family regulator
MNIEVFGALSSPYRVEIIQMLRSGELTAGEIVEQFDIAQPSVSRHLDVLKKADLVISNKKGTQIFYSLNEETLKELLIFTAKLLPD